MGNVILIISGPAGSGKNTVAESLMAQFPNLKRVVTSTSRPPRGAEVDGVDYRFLSTEDFERGIADGDFYEYAKVHDRYYGTSKRAVLDLFEAGKDIVLIIDVQGAQTWRKIAESDKVLSKAVHDVFITPKSIDELVSRLRGRGTESEEEIARRMQTAVEEFNRRGEFEFSIDSKTRAEDLDALKKIYLKLKDAQVR